MNFFILNTSRVGSSVCSCNASYCLISGWQEIAGAQAKDHELMLTLCWTKGTRTCITSQVTDTDSAGANNSVRRPQNIRYMNCELIKTQWFLLFRGPFRRHPVRCCCRTMKLPEETEVWDSAMGNLGSRQWGNLTTFCVVCVGSQVGQPAAH